MSTNDQLTALGVTCALVAGVGAYLIDEPHAGACFLLAAVFVWLFNRSA